MNGHDLVDRQMRQKELLVRLKKEMKITYQKKKGHESVSKKKRWRIWRRVKYWCCQEFTGDDWDNIVEWAEKHCKGKSLKSVCSKLGFSVAV